ncbi:hypothetical protein K2P97_04555 [bacterium]|nr:hypothetical protein [bacterium]
MDVCRIITSILFIGFVSLSLQASEIDQCLSYAVSQEHRLEKEDAVKMCFDKHKSKIDKNTCYNLIKKKVSALDSSKLNEEITSTCFYDTTAAVDINSCLTETKKFKSAYNHDDAVFFCYQQFQEKIGKNECLNAANQLIFPLKKEYLKEHCNNNSN